jgi:hypothetical protein
MSQQRYQFKIRQLAILVFYSAVMASHAVSDPDGAFWVGIGCSCIALLFVIKRGAGVLGTIIVVSAVFVFCPIAVFVQFRFFGDPGVFDGLGPKRALVAEFACGLIFGAIVSALIYLSFRLANRYIDRLRPNDDSCGPIVWRPLDETPNAVSNLR